MKSGVRLIGGLAIALAALTQYTSAQAPPINARTIEDRDHVTVMELSGGYDRQPEASRAYEENIRKAVARELLRQHQDDYDFIVSFTGFPFNLGSDEEGTRVGGRYYAIKNDVQGIGQAEFDRSAEWGSAGRLQGYIDMGALGSLVTDPSDPGFETTLSTLSHEVAHRWSAHLRFQNADGTPNSSLLGAQGAHWSFFLQSHNSVLYGNDWRDNGNGSFTSVGRSRSYYSPLDLYAMGVIDRSEVPPFFLIENAAGDPARLPEVGATVTGTARTITIDDVIAAEGERVPEAVSSPRQFKIAFVYLVRPGEGANGAQLRAINNVREAFATRMLILTGGRAAVEVFPDLPDAPITAPDTMLPPSSGPRTAALDLAQGMSWLLSRQGGNGRFADSPSTGVRDTSAVIELLAGQPAAFGPRQAALAWLSSLVDATNVDTVARRMTAIAPQYSPADSAYLTNAQHASGGWGLRAGDEADAFDTALALSALQIAAPSAAIARLTAAQLPDGSWPMQPGGSGSILATAAVLGLSGKFASAPLTTALARASAWLELRQNSDGGFGESGSTVFETALAILHASRLSSTTVDVRWAVDFLQRGQLADGSWNESVYETALAIRALQIGNLPNVALVASSLAFAPADPVEGEIVTLTALLANTGAIDLTNVTVRFYDGHPSSGGLPIGEEVIVASLPAQARVPIAAIWNTTDLAGTHQIVALADASLNLNESNEADNLLTGPLTVRPPPAGPDLSVANADLVFTPDSLRSVPQAQAFDARIGNLGRTAAAGVPVALFAGDPAAGGARIADTVVDVPARGSALVSFNVTITTPGERRYFVVADPDGALIEADEANNVASRTLAVTSAFDLFVTPGSVTLSENPILLGRDLQIGARVGNSGTADVFAARVRVFIDLPGGAIEVATLTHDLPAGQTRTISATWRTSRALAGAPVIVHVDPLNAFSETSEANNQASATLSVPSSTDANLRVTHQELVVAAPVLQGGSTTLQIPVHNTGVADAASVEVAFYLGVPGAGGVQIGATQTVALIAAGGQATASVIWDQITTFGDKLIYAVVDPAGTVIEFDEQDNAAFITVDVLSLPDLAVSSASLSFSPAFPRDGEPVTVSVLVSNLGEQSVAHASVQLFLGAPAAGGLPVGAPQVIAVEGGAFASVLAQLDALTLGASTMFVVVDAANAVAELNEANNIASKTIGVQDGSFFFTNAYFSPNGDEVQDATEFLFRLTEASASAVHAIDRYGRVARQFTLESSASSGSVTWDGRDTLGRIVPDGSYAFALIDGAGNRLASASVVVDNNNLPVGEAFGSQYLLQSNLTADTGLTAPNISGHPPIDYQPAAWLADDSGLVSFVASQLRCVSTLGNYYVFCTNYQFAASPEVGVYLTSPDGVTRTRITPDSWARETIVPGGPVSGATGPARTGTQLMGVVPSPNGEKVLVALRNYMYYPVACGNCGGLPLYTFNWTSDLELWAVGVDGSSPVRVAALPRSTDRVPQATPDVTWSPDAQLITIYGVRSVGGGYEYSIDVVRADGSGAPVRIATSPTSPGTYLGNNNVFWSPDSSRVIYESGDHSIQQRIYFSVRPDGTDRQELYREFGQWTSSITPDKAMWLDHERFAMLLDDASQRRQLWLLSTAGAPRQLLSGPEMDVSKAAAAPSGSPIVFSDSDSSANFPNFPQQKSTGVWAVDGTGAVSKIYDASAQNLGIGDLAVSRDGRRVVFSEQVVSRFDFCFDGEGFGFCGDAVRILGVIDRRDRTVRVVQTELEVRQPPYVIGFFPDGNSLLIEDRSRPDVYPLSAVSLDDGRITELLSDPNASFSSPYSVGHLGTDARLHADGQVLSLRFDQGVSGRRRRHLDPQFAAQPEHRTAI